MKKIQIFESAIIGFFVGVIVSTYILFITSNGKSLGLLLNTVSLTPLLKVLPQSHINSLIANFVFYILVFIIYGIILGMFMSKNIKVKIFIFLLIALMCTGIFFEQKNIHNSPISISENSFENTVVSPATMSSKKAQYFKNQTHGDLNNDNLNDTAFVLEGIDDQGNQEYYLAASLNSNNGYIDTNLIFIKQQISITGITIENNTIQVSYTQTTEDKPVSEELVIENFYAKIIDTKLEEIKEVPQDAPLDTETEGDTQ